MSRELSDPRLFVGATSDDRGQRPGWAALASRYGLGSPAMNPPQAHDPWDADGAADDRRVVARVAPADYTAGTALLAAAAALVNDSHDNSDLHQYDSFEDGGDSSKRKVRHNQTERRRVDRMNQLFKKVRPRIWLRSPPPTDAPDAHQINKSCCPPRRDPSRAFAWRAQLSMAIEEPSAPETQRGGDFDGDDKPSQSSKVSKADVLEGAINLIAELRKQLIEERLTRGAAEYGENTASRRG